jgi:transcriptional regulator with XRE-family HTH domain
MTPQELLALRTRLRLTRDELARQLDISPSRLADYEGGQTRTKPPRPAPIPRVVEFACRWLEGQAPSLGPAEKAAQWRDFVASLPKVSAVVDDRREALYAPPRGR